LAYEEDPAAASAEFGGEFRRDIEQFLDREIIASVTVPGREFLMPKAGHDYVAFCDPSGGSGDSMTLAVAHAIGFGESRIAVLDLIREVRPPFSPDEVVRDFTYNIGRYGLDEITGDRYGAEWVRERFQARGVWYRPSELTKSELYLELSAAMHSRWVELLDSKRLSSQLATLERRSGRSGKDSVDHPPRAHDDLANAAAGALWLALKPERKVEGIRY
jgi:hypothetical protein